MTHDRLKQKRIPRFGADALTARMTPFTRPTAGVSAALKNITGIASGAKASPRSASTMPPYFLPFLIMTNENNSFPAENSPRPPSEQELADVWAWLKAEGRADMYLLEEESWFNQFWIAVFDHYCTGSPGYSGKLLYLLWDGSPEYCTVFVCRNGTMVAFAEHVECGHFFPLHHDGEPRR